MLYTVMHTLYHLTKPVKLSRVPFSIFRTISAYIDSPIPPVPISKSVQKIMGQSRFVVLLVSSLLFLSFGYGFGRVALMETVEHKHSTARTEEYSRKMRIQFEIMDYAEPEPNKNPKNGNIVSPPSPIPAPSPRG